MQEREADSKKEFAEQARAQEEAEMQFRKFSMDPNGFTNQMNPAHASTAAIHQPFDQMQSLKNELEELKAQKEKMKKYETEHASTPANLQPFDQMQSLKNELEELKWQKEQMKRYEAAHASRLQKELATAKTELQHFHNLKKMTSRQPPPSLTPFGDENSAAFQQLRELQKELANMKAQMSLQQPSKLIPNLLPVTF